MSVGTPIPRGADAALTTPDRPHETVQLLTPTGERVTHPRFDVDDLTDDDLRGLLRDLVLVRRVDTEATALQRQGELGIWAPLLGQEAAQIGSGRAMAPGDRAFPTYREHGVAWCRGVDPLRIAGLFRGVDGGGWDPDEHGFSLYAIVIGSQTLHAVGYAMGVQRDGTDDAVLAYFGDGASSQGDVSEAFGWAAVQAAPVVFFCQNNHWAISEPLERQTRVPLHQRASGFGFEGVRVDGNDVLACLAVTRAALAKARAGGGPTLVEAVTYRMGAHTTSDDPSRYRDPHEVELWRQRDPLARLRTHLEQTGVVDAAWSEALAAEADALAARFREGVCSLPDPAPESMFDHVYAEPTRPLREQRASFLDYSASFLDAAG